MALLCSCWKPQSKGTSQYRCLECSYWHNSPQLLNVFDLSTSTAECWRMKVLSPALHLFSRRARHLLSPFVTFIAILSHHILFIHLFIHLSLKCIHSVLYLCYSICVRLKVSRIVVVVVVVASHHHDDHYFASLLCRLTNDLQPFGECIQLLLCNFTCCSNDDDDGVDDEWTADLRCQRHFFILFCTIFFLCWSNAKWRLDLVKFCMQICEWFRTELWWML